MDFCEPGRPYKEIGGVIESFVQQQGYTSVKVRLSYLCVCWRFHVIVYSLKKKNIFLGLNQKSIE
jgi:hypothetical protein